METDITLIRHGETDWNRKMQYQGQTDIPLNKKGNSQAEKLAEYLAGENFDFIYSSDLKRAAGTAEIIASRLKMNLVTIKGLREMSFGDWEGMDYKELRENYHYIFQDWIKDPASTAPPGGESLAQFQNRVVDSMEKVVERHKGQSGIVVCHGGTIRVWLAFLLDMPLGRNRRLEVDNTSLSRIRFYDENPVIRGINLTTHLD